MRNPYATLLIAPFLAVTSTAAAADAAGEAPAGQKIFLAQECNSCHTVKSAGIALLDPEEAAPAEDGEAAPPDLSDVGPKHNAEFLHKFLTKQETLHDKKHMKRFKGEDGELDSLVSWLLTLKAAE